jgi:hypothetical protein
VTGELISGLAEVLGVVFVAFVKDVGVTTKITLIPMAIYYI